jgi:hypothetical protein
LKSARVAVLALAGAYLAASGCVTFLDDDYRAIDGAGVGSSPSEQPGSNSGSLGRSGSSGVSDADGSDGDASGHDAEAGNPILCGVAPIPPGDDDDDECPDVCTGGCAANVCLIDCSGDDSCEELSVDCPPGFACSIDCLGVESCQKMQLRCADLYACTILCNGPHSCKDMKVACSSGTCAVTCSYKDACEHMRLACTSGSCDAICAADLDHLPTLDNCTSACRCTPC